MLISMLQAKLHRVRVTGTDLHYEGSCAIDEDFLERAGIREFQHLEIYNVENGERFTTYALKASRGSGQISLNGASARKAMIGDRLIICTYASYTEDELARYRQLVVLFDEDGKPHRNTRSVSGSPKPG